MKKRTDTDNNYGSVINNRNKAIITFRQGIGRGLRNNHDKVFIAVCDPRIYDKKNSSFLYWLSLHKGTKSDKRFKSSLIL